MFRSSIPLLALVVLAACAYSPLSVMGEVIVADSLGNTIGLPLDGGLASATITNAATTQSISPYTLFIMINDGTQLGSVPGTTESFFLDLPLLGKYGAATLICSKFTTSFDETAPCNSGNNDVTLATKASNTNIGLYVFVFTVPPGKLISVGLHYFAHSSGNTLPTVEDDVFFLLTNPLSWVTGDPQFIGLRGQSYQVHGIDGAIYAIVSQPAMQVNARFVFLSSGECPMLSNGEPDTNCYSHPGSYLGEMSWQLKSPVNKALVHRVLVRAGSADHGFAAVTVDGHALQVGNTIVLAQDLSITLDTTHKATIVTSDFTFSVLNSDMFVNQAVSVHCALSQLNTTTGLLGSSNRAAIYASPLKYIPGEVDDYVIGEDDMFGHQFVYSQFVA